MLCLGAMAAQAAVLWRQGEPRGCVLAVGGALFMLSDALLATNKFAGPLPLASLWVLSSYWAAQWCIATGLAPKAASLTSSASPASSTPQSPSAWRGSR
ncbi:lysoplasmalogenase family protein [Ideonella paludis]|uniref:lysoplasmalogenase family protein n=1 Tax=Ideonella paludis TaxID=1233411 RepID=UPI00362BF297